MLSEDYMPLYIVLQGFLGGFFHHIAIVLMLTPEKQNSVVFIIYNAIYGVFISFIRKEGLLRRLLFYG